jgi:hypothetical protein
MERESPVIHIRDESAALLVFDKLRDFIVNRIRMKAPTKTKRAKRTKKPKHRVVTRAFDFPMKENASQSLTGVRDCRRQNRSRLL